MAEKALHMWPIRRYQTVDSTNEECRRLSSAGVEGPFVVVADTQSAGRGRMGRSWESPAGCNLYFSLRFMVDPSPALPSLSLVAGLAMAEVLTLKTGVPVRLKWPNDLMVNGKKCGGILAETISTGKTESVVIGIGINVNLLLTQLPSNVALLATSLAIESGRQWNRDELLQILLDKLSVRLSEWMTHGFVSMAQDYTQHSMLVGRYVEVDEGGRQRSGTVVGFDHDGALLIETLNGLERIIVGDVHVIRY